MKKQNLLKEFENQKIEVQSQKLIICGNYIFPTYNVCTAFDEGCCDYDWKESKN